MFDSTYSCAGLLPTQPYNPGLMHSPKSHHTNHTNHENSTLPHAHPFTFTPLSSSFTFTARTTANLQTALQNGWANPTLKSYSYHVQLFTNFCETENIPQSQRFPSDEIVLCAYAASRLGNISGDTARKHISGLKAWHSFHDVPWKGGRRLHYVLNGVSRLSPPSSSRPPRIPVNHTMIKLLHDNLHPDSNFDVAVLACATVAFWGQCRLGELLPYSRRSPTTHIPTRSNLHQSHKNKHLHILTLPRTKTSLKGQDIILIPRHDHTDPIHALKRHLRHNHPSHNIPLFSFRSPQGTTYLTNNRFMQRCNEIWHKAGYPHVTGHSFRIGGTTELLLTGIPPDIVKKSGRWSSDAFLRYWRSTEDIIDTHTRPSSNLDSHRPYKRRRTHSH